jgi:RNA polymerase sigma factor (sigma-70 family)
VLGACERITGDRHDAEEAAQVVFLILARKAGSLRRADRLAAWLHRTARFVALRARAVRLRRSRREAPLETDEEPATAAEEPDELRERLDAALDRLPAIYREALLLHYVEGRSCEEIAPAVGASAETVAMRLSRGRELLRRRLRQPTTEVFTRTLAGLAAMPTAKLAPATVLSPTPAAQALLSQCLMAAKAAMVATAVVGATAAAALVVGGVALAQQLTAAEPHADPPPPQPPVAAEARACGLPLCESWEARLHAALQRPVTIHASGADALAALRRIGGRCELPMVVDLAPDHASLPRIAIDVDAAPLGEVLDGIARQAALRGEFRAGTVWWEDSGSPQSGAGPTALWVYELDPAKTRAENDVAYVVDELRRSAPADWGREGVDIEQRYGDELFVWQTPAMQLRVEALLSRYLARPPAADDPAVRGAVKLLPAALSDMPAGERRLRTALAAPVTLDGGATRLAEVVDAVAKAAGVRVMGAAGVSLDRPLARLTAEIHLQGLEARHALALALRGSGLHAELRAVDADGSVVIAAGTAPLVRRRYSLTAVQRAFAAVRGPEVFPVTQDYIDLVQKLVMPGSWTAEGVAIQEESGAMIVEQTVEAQDAIEEMLSRLARMQVTGDASNRFPVPPALTIELPSSAEF